MMKRILLVVVMGVSFSPSVFASSDLSTYRPLIGHTGELGESEIDHRGTQCEIAKVLKEMDRNEGGKNSGIQSGSAL